MKTMMLLAAVAASMLLSFSAQAQVQPTPVFAANAEVQQYIYDATDPPTTYNTPVMDMTGYASVVVSLRTNSHCTHTTTYFRLFCITATDASMTYPIDMRDANMAVLGGAGVFRSGIMTVRGTLKYFVVGVQAQKGVGVDAGCQGTISIVPKAFAESVVASGDVTPGEQGPAKLLPVGGFTVPLPTGAGGYVAAALGMHMVDRTGGPSIGAAVVEGAWPNGTAYASDVSDPQPITVGGTDGTSVRTFRTDATGALVVSGGSVASTDIPSVPTCVNLSAGVSGAVTGLTLLSCLRISCDADAEYRTGTATPTALSTDNRLYSRTVESRCLTGTNTALAFISGSSTTCCVAVIP